MIVMFRNIPNIGNCFNLHSATKEKSEDVFFILNKTMSSTIKNNTNANLLIAHLINLHSVDKEINELDIANIDQDVTQENFMLHKDLLDIYNSIDKKNQVNQFLLMELKNGFSDKKESQQTEQNITKTLVNEFIYILCNVNKDDRIYVMQELLKLCNSSLELYKNGSSLKIKNKNNTNYIINRVITDYTAIIISAIYKVYKNNDDLQNMTHQSNNIETIIDIIINQLKQKINQLKQKNSQIDKTNSQINKVEIAFVEFILHGNNQDVLNQIITAKTDVDDISLPFTCDDKQKNTSCIKDCYDKINRVHSDTYNKITLQSDNEKQQTQLNKLQKQLQQSTIKETTAQNKLNDKSEQKNDTQKEIDTLTKQIQKTQQDIKKLTDNTNTTMSELSNAILNNKTQNINNSQENNDILEQRFNNLENQLNDVKTINQNTTEKKSNVAKQVASTSLVAALGGSAAMLGQQAVQKIHENNDPVDGLATDAIYANSTNYDKM